MPEDSFNLVLHIKIKQILPDIAKIQIKSEPITLFGGTFSIMKQIDALLSKIIDSTLGKRYQPFSYHNCKILRPLMCMFLCDG